MITTHDFDKAGTTTFRANWYWDDGHEPCAGDGPAREVNSLEAAQRFLDQDRPPAKGSGEWWCRVDKGSYVAVQIHDSEFGVVHDASWEQDDSFYVAGFLKEDGQIDWDVHDVTK